MQKQMREIGLVQLRLWKEALERCKAYLPELEEELEEDIEEIEEYIALPAFPPKVLDNIQAHLRLIRERIEKYRARIPAEVLGYLTIDNAFVEAHVKISVEVHITIKAPVDLAAEFREELEDFREELAEIRLALKIVPVELKVTLGLPAVQELVEAAEDYMVRAEAAFGRRELRKALVLLYAANAKLEQAESILEYAEYWEEEYQEIWEEYEQKVKDYMIEYAKREMLDAEIPENVALEILERAIVADPTLEELTTIVAAMIDLHEAGASPEAIVAVFTLVEAKVAAGIDRELLLEEFSTIVAAKIDMLDAEIPENVALEILERAIVADPTLEELTTIVAAMIDLHEAGASPEAIVAVFTLVEAKVAAGIDRELLLEEFSTIVAAKIDMLEAEIPEDVALEILERAIAADPTLEDLTTIVAAEIERFKAGVPPVPE
jgi:tetratricopeptide (TPR) repeat protein